MNTLFNKLLSTSILLFLLQSPYAFGQLIEQDSLINQFNNFRKNHFEEKIFVHTDKDNYLAGEILWFRIYNVDASFHRPLNLSTVAYMELTDINNRPVLTEKTGLKNGFGDGSFFISQNIPSGNYTLRVYTSWMKNQGPEFYFGKKITVINSQRPIDQTPTISEQKPIIQVFPEGGNLVSGIQSRVAIKISDASGIGIRTTAIIYDENQNMVMVVPTNQFGMANFLFTPVEGHHYEARITLPGTELVSTQLPGALPSGFVLNAKNQKDKLLISVIGTDAAANSSPWLYLLVHCRQSIKNIQKINIGNKTVSVELNNQLLGDGINHITLFDQFGQPVCERLVFKYPSQLPTLTIDRNQKFYEPREKVLFTLTSPVSSDLSLSVYKTDSIQLAQESFITDYLLLSSDLGGNIQSPGWYFRDTNDSVVAAMDNLMLTNGWRRFNWKQVIKNENPIIRYLPELNGQLITGKISSTGTGKPAKGISAFLTIPSIQPFFRPSTSDSLGNIQFLVKNVYGTPGIILQTAAEDSNYRIENDNPFSTNYSRTFWQPFKKPGTGSPTLLEQHIALQVRQSFTPKSLNIIYNPSEDSLPFFTYPNYTYLLDNYTRFTTIEEIFREFVPFVSVRKHSGQYSLPLYNELLNNGTFDFEPLLLVDGIPVFNTNKLMAYDPLKVRKIDLITRKYFIGPLAFNGIISLTTYNGNLDGFDLDPKALVIDYESLQLKRQFSQPVYENDLQRKSHIADFRYLLYWDPNIILKKNVPATVNFYTSDVKGKFIAILQGISNEGQPVIHSSSFEVK